MIWLVSRNLMEIVGLNVGNYIVGAIFGDGVGELRGGESGYCQRRGARPQILLSILRTR